MLIDYYLAGGRLTLGKKEFLLELLRDDSVLRRLLGLVLLQLRLRPKSKCRILALGSNQRLSLILVQLAKLCFSELIRRLLARALGFFVCYPSPNVARCTSCTTEANHSEMLS